ncbi:MAG: hypothetical protein RIE73_22490 [Coleofasciculus sp. C1-SOL-03]
MVTNSRSRGNLTHINRFNSYPCPERLQDAISEQCNRWEEVIGNYLIGK